MYYVKKSRIRLQISRLYQNWTNILGPSWFFYTFEERYQQFDVWMEREHGIITIRSNNKSQTKLGFKSQGDFLMFMLRWS